MRGGKLRVTKDFLNGSYRYSLMAKQGGTSMPSSMEGGSCLYLSQLLKGSQMAVGISIASYSGEFRYGWISGKDIECLALKDQI